MDRADAILPPFPAAPDAGLSLLTPAEMGAADRAAMAAGTSGPALMEAAGSRLAEA